MRCAVHVQPFVIALQVKIEAANLKAKLQSAEACLDAAEAKMTELEGKAGEIVAQVSRLTTPANVLTPCCPNFYQYGPIPAVQADKERTALKAQLGTLQGEKDDLLSEAERMQSELEKAAAEHVKVGLAAPLGTCMHQRLPRVPFWLVLNAHCMSRHREFRPGPSRKLTCMALKACMHVKSRMHACSAAGSEGQGGAAGAGAGACQGGRGAEHDARR